MSYTCIQCIILLFILNITCSCTPINNITQKNTALTPGNGVIDIEDTHIHPSSPLCIWSANGWVFQGYKDDTTMVPKHDDSILCSKMANLIKIENLYLYQELSGSTIHQYPLQQDKDGYYWLGKTEVYNPEDCIERTGSVSGFLYGAFDWTDKKRGYYDWNISTFLDTDGSVGCFDIDSEEKVLIGSDFFGDKNGIYWIVPISGGPGQRWTRKIGVKTLDGNNFRFLDGSQLQFSTILRK